MTQLLLALQGTPVPLTDENATPFHIAAQHVTWKVLSQLYEMWPDGVKLLDRQGRTPLRCATWQGWKATTHITVLLLSQWYPDAVKMITFNETPLSMAVQNGDEIAVCGMLALCPSSAQVLLRHRRIVLHTAAESGHEEIVKALLTAYPDGLTHRDECGRVPCDVVAGDDQKSVTLRKLLNPQRLTEVRRLSRRYGPRPADATNSLSLE